MKPPKTAPTKGLVGVAMHGLLASSVRLGGWWSDSIGNMVVAGPTHIEFPERTHNGMIPTLLTVRKWLIPGPGPLPKNPHMLNKPGWLKILKLLAELCVLSFKLRRAHRRLLNQNARLGQLLAHNDHLVLEQRQLLLQQRDHLVLEVRGGDGCSDVLDDLDSSHGGCDSGSENYLANDERTHPLPGAQRRDQGGGSSHGETPTEERVAGCSDAACSPLLLFVVKDGQSLESKALHIVAHWIRNGMKGPIMLDNMAPAVEVGMYLKSLGIESLRINVKVSGLEVLTANESYSVVDVTDNSEVLLCLSIKDRVTNGYSSERSIGVQDQHGELIRKLHPVMVAALKLKGVE
jgi:hypothetical protein